MRCLRMSATIPVSLCLSKQAARNIHCQECPQGAEIKKNGGNDMDVEKIKEELAQGIKPAIMRICSTCKQEKGISQFYKSSQVCRKCRIEYTRARMKEANKPEDKFLDPVEPEIGQIVFLDQNIHPVPAEDTPARTLSVEIAGQRIVLCECCAKRYLKI